jgi:hypothetical protein
MSEGTSEASAAKKGKLGQRFCPEYCIEFSCIMKSTREHYAYCKQDLSGWTHIYNKTVEKCQVNNISGTPELDINYSMGGWGRATSGNFNFYWQQVET